MWTWKRSLAALAGRYGICRPGTLPGLRIHHLPCPSGGRSTAQPGRGEAPQSKVPSTRCAINPNQVCCRDIPWLPGPASGLFYYLYLILDLYSCKIIAWEIHDREASDLAAWLIRKACLAEDIVAHPLVLHATTAVR